MFGRRNDQLQHALPDHASLRAVQPTRSREVHGDTVQDDRGLGRGHLELRW
jgi:hypothetical protein